MQSGLEVRDLTVGFGGVTAADGVSLQVPAGRVVGLIGPNGAGKTTVLDAVTGLVGTRAGSIAVDGTRVDGLSAHRRARLGLARSFQALSLFEDLTVAENLQVAAERGSGVLRRGRRSAGAAAVAGILDRLELSGLASRLPAALSHAQRSLVSLGRALAGDPSVLLLDEPAAGLDGPERAALGGRIRSLADDGRAVLVVEHDLAFVFDLCNEVVVLDRGRVIATGPPPAIRDDPLVQTAYLGPAGLPSGSSNPLRRRPSIGPTVLEVAGLTAGYGGGAVVRGVNLTVRAGEVVALVGLNGAGKTTTLAAISGLLDPESGTVVLDGRPAPRSPHARARAGMAFVPSGRSVFSELTVGENLRLAASGRGGAAPPAGFEVLEPLLPRRAGLLSGGEARMVALARALLPGPARPAPLVLLVDELSMGLAPALVADLLTRLRRLADDRGTAVLLVEQHVGLALDVADRVYALQTGRVVAEGHADEMDLGTVLFG